MTKEKPIVNFFNFFSKTFVNCRNDSNKMFYSHSKPYWSSLRNSVRFERNFLQPYTIWGPMCAMTSRPFDWDLKNMNWIDQESVNFELFQFFQRLSTRFERNFLQPFYTLLGTYVCNEINIVRLGFKKPPKLTKKQPFVNFSIFSKTVVTTRTKLSPAIWHYVGAYVCNEINIVRLGFKKSAEIDQGTAICEFVQICQKQSTRFERYFLQSI